MYKDTKIRSILKTVSWRLLATCTTITLVLIFTKELRTAFEIGALELILKLIIYYGHERIWNRVKIGRHEVRPFVLWITGLPGSGKMTLAQGISDYITNLGYKAELLAGEKFHEIFAHTDLNRRAGREEIVRIGYFASMLEKNGTCVVAPFFSPDAESRKNVAALCKNFIEVYVSTPLSVCKEQLPEASGMDWRKWRRNYEAPVNADIEIDLSRESEISAIDKIRKVIVKYL